MLKRQSIAIIGAGLSGLAVARALQPDNEVTLFEKSRGAGGRMATRYAGDFEFDHGAQFFTVRTRRFAQFLEPLLASGSVAPWQARFAEIQSGEITATRQWDAEYPHFVGVPTMSRIGRTLAAELDVRLEHRIVACERRDGGWHLTGADGREYAAFDWLIVTAPAAQAAELLPANSPLQAVAREVKMLACCALMLGFDDPAAADTGWDAALIGGADISWVSRNSAKPGRKAATTFVVHSTNAWATTHIEDPPETIKQHLLAQLLTATGIDGKNARHIDLQRWRYANLPRQAESFPQVDDANQLGVCGDWLIRGRVEAAFSSAARLLDELPAAG